MVRRLGEDGEMGTGERTINDYEAQIIRKIFREFSEGHSPKAIAHKLDEDQVPGPLGPNVARYRDPRPQKAWHRGLEQ